jgi:amidase
MDRREFIRLGTGVAAAPALAGLAPADHVAAGRSHRPPHRDIEEVTIAELQDRMAKRRLTSRELVDKYIDRIEKLDQRGPRLNSVIEINPDAEKIARDLDRERRAGHVRGPLHGIPILLKDNVDTADRTQTAAGSLALVGEPPAQDATVAAKLRAAGAVILGKAGLSEWANFRSFHSSSGWSGRGGQVNNPYVLDRNPCGSSSGSGAAVSANLCAASLGTETDGSIVCPSGANGVVGIKPTVGLTSRAGVVPIAASQDTVGPHGRTVADAAAVLGAIASTVADPRDSATAASRNRVFSDYTQFLDPDGLAGTRIGVARNGVTGYSEETDAVFDAAIQAIEDAGATVVPADIPTIDQINIGAEEITVLLFEFKRDLNAYLATRGDVPVHTLAEAIEFNEDHADVEMRWFLQELFLLAQNETPSQADYDAALAEERRIGREAGIDAVLTKHNLDAIIAPTGSPAWTTDLVNGDHFLGASSGPAAVAGYPLISVPAGDSFGLPVGLTFMGTAFSEPTLIKLASGFEAATGARRKPEFLPTLPTTSGDRGRRSRRQVKATTQASAPATVPMLGHL